MDYEKAYKEAIDRMKSWANGEHPECFGEAQKAAEFVFPELKEPEDEKIRKELIRDINIAMPIEAAQRYISWLEKTKEQKTVEWSEEDKEMINNIIDYMILL